MADFVDNLSDAELRSKLAEYGSPVMPVTPSTRKVLVKKLKMLVDTKSKVSSDGRHSLAQYSSGEDSESELKPKTNSTKNRRQTIGTMLPPAKTSSLSSTPKPKKNVFKNADSSFVKDPSPVTRSVNRRSTRTQYTDSDENNDFSDVDIEVINTSRTSTNSKNSNHTVKNKPQTEEPDTQFNSSPSSYNYRSSFSNPKTISSTEVTDSTSKVSSLEHLNQIRARLSLNRSERTTTSPPTYDRKTDGRFSSYGSSFASTSPSSNNLKERIGEEHTPYFSEFTRRLSQMTGSGAKLSDPYKYKNDIIKENENGNNYSRSYKYSTALDRNVSKEFKKSQEKNIFRNNMVSFTLVGVVCIFFMALSFLYIGMKSEQPQIIDIEVSDLPYCKQGDKFLKPGVNCVGNVKNALNLLQIIQPELTKRAVNYHCGNDAKTPPYMSEPTIIQFVKQHTEVYSPETIREHLYDLEVIILHKPELKIGLVEIKNLYAPTSASTEKQQDNIVHRDTKTLLDRDVKNLALQLINPELPLQCWILNWIYALTFYIVIATVGSLVIFIGAYVVKLMKKRNQEKNKQIYAMVEQIIDILMQNSKADKPDNYLAITHVRDMLIPIQERKKVAPIWDAAVEFIEHNESRVRPEVQIVAGEEYRVWRWLGAPSCNNATNRGKVWQGQAFETQEGSVNSIPVSPTQCLKIRQMFDKNESAANWTTIIKDAILEKCGDTCRISHIGIDKATCCVYVQCASQEDAGVAYRNLHGWWYDGKLITVKYIRLARYLERFPDATSTNSYLKPSNNKKLSLRNDWSSNEDN